MVEMESGAGEPKQGGKVASVPPRDELQRMRESAGHALRHNGIGALSAVLGYGLLAGVICAMAGGSMENGVAQAGQAALDRSAGIFSMLKSSFPGLGSPADTCSTTCKAAEGAGLSIIHWCGFAVYAAYAASECLHLCLSTDAPRRRMGVLVLASCATMAISYLLMAADVSPGSIVASGAFPILPTRHIAWLIASSTSIYVVWSSGTKSSALLMQSLGINVLLFTSRLLCVMLPRRDLHWLAFGASVLCSASQALSLWQMISSVPIPDQGKAGMSTHSKLCSAVKVAVFYAMVFFYVVYCLQFIALPAAGVGLALVLADLALTVVLSAAVQHGVFVAEEDRELYMVQLEALSVMYDMKDQEMRKDRFFAAMTHELRTPLNGVVGLTEALLMTQSKNLTEKVEGTVRTVHESGRRLQQLINNILDSASVNESKLRIVMKRMSIPKLLDEVQQLIRPLLRQGVKLVVKLQSGLPHIQADYQRITQVMYNILGNAAKFTDSGEILVKAVLDKGMLNIKVRDSGMGIPADKQGQIFKPFEQVDSGNTRLYGGTGLGLSLAQSIVEAHHGQLTVESEFGKGSTFTITLPVESMETEKAAQVVNWQSHLNESRTLNRLDSKVSTGTPTSTASGMHNVAEMSEPAAFPSEEMTSRLSIDSEISGISANSEQDQQEDGKLKSWLKGISTNSQNSTNSQSAEVPKELEVLCVDDEMVNQIVITELLTASGFKLTSAMSGQEGLKILAERHKQGGVAAFPHLILMDLMMPGMTGLEATKTIRATYPDTSMPIIMLSANDDEASVCTALEIGCNDYIHKPFKAAELLARVGLQTTKTMQIAEAPPAQEAEGCNDDLMLELLPLSVLDRLKAGSSHIADKLDQVTVVMCDIVGFENLVSSMPAKPVVRMVDDFFKKLDGLTDKYNLYKLEPVGSIYMAVCGFDDTSNKLPAEVRAIRMAQGMLDATTHMTTPLGDPLQIRVTVNTGPAAAGVVGAKAPRYSFFGEAVSAFGMCVEPAEFPVGCVHVSSRTHDALQSSGNSMDFQFHSLKPPAQKPPPGGISRRQNAKAAAATTEPSDSREGALLLEYGDWEAALKAKALAGAALKSKKPYSPLSNGRSSYQDLQSTGAKAKEREGEGEVFVKSGSMEDVAPGSPAFGTNGAVKTKTRGSKLSNRGRSSSFSLLGCISPPKEAMEQDI